MICLEEDSKVDTRENASFCALGSSSLSTTRAGFGVACYLGWGLVLLDRPAKQAPYTMALKSTQGQLKQKLILFYDPLISGPWHRVSSARAKGVTTKNPFY